MSELVTKSGRPALSTTERQRHFDDARDRLIRAAAALTSWWEDDNLAFALLEGGRALYAIAEGDPEERAHDRVQAWLAAVRE